MTLSLLIYVVLGCLLGAGFTFAVLHFKFTQIRRNLEVKVEAEKSKSIEMLNNIRMDVEKERHACHEALQAGKNKVLELQAALQQYEEKEEHNSSGLELLSEGELRKIADESEQANRRIAELEEQVKNADGTVLRLEKALAEALESNASSQGTDGELQIIGSDWGLSGESDGAGDSDTASTKVTELQTVLEEREEELASVRQESRQVEESLSSARQEIEDLYGEIEFLKGEVEKGKKVKSASVDDDFLVYTPGSHFLPGSVARALMNKKK